MAKLQVAAGVVVLTRLQAWVVEQIRAGRSESWITCRHTGDSSTYHSIKVALRQKGVISLGRQGVKGSVRVLVGPVGVGYVVDPASRPVSPRETPLQSKYERRKEKVAAGRLIEEQYRRLGLM